MKLPRSLLHGFCAIVSIASVNLSAQLSPHWWTNPTTQIWDGSTQDNYALVNAGQLKHVATMAKAYLENTYGPIDWAWAYQGSGVADPFAFSNQDNYEAVNAGQLKAVCYGFYKVLYAYGHGSFENLSDYNGVYSSLDGFTVPWDISVTQNYSLINVGQLKLAFSFWPDRDTADGDGLPDYWERRYFGGTVLEDYFSDFDLDACPNYVEYLLHADPAVATSKVTAPCSGLTVF